MKKRFKIAVASGKGGVGKSMLSSSLCLFLAENYKIIALDCDVDAPNLAIWLNEVENWQSVEEISTVSKPVFDKKKCTGCGKCVENCQFGALKMKDGYPQLNPFICEGCGACQIICPEGAITMEKVNNALIKKKQSKNNFPLLIGQLRPGQTGSGKIVSAIKEKAEKEDWQIMIIDSSPGTGCPVIAALRDVDFVLLVTEPTVSGFADLKRIYQVVDHFNLNYGVVVNKWDLNKKVTDEIKSWAKDKFLGKITYDQRIFDKVAQMIPIWQTDLPVKKEIKEIYQNLRQRG